MYYFSNNLKFFRLKDGFTQEQIANLIGFKRTTWTSYENGNSVPNFEDLIKLAAYFEISETDLIHKDLTEGKPIEKKGKKKKYESAAVTTTKTSHKEPDTNEIIASLKETAEAQKKTIEAQNLTIATLTEEIKRLKAK